MDEQNYFKEQLGIPELLADLLNDPAYQAIKRNMPPQYYHRDGKPIVGNELMPDFIQWAMLFETEDRHVATTITPYGERLSTVFLGMDHSFIFTANRTPILFETMLFAPRSDAMRKDLWGRLSRAAVSMKELGHIEYEESDEEKRIKKNYPHDNLQLRYATEREAKDRHEQLKLQCLIPPRWRRFLLYTIGGDATWE
jgi:hypothetical protein